MTYDPIGWSSTITTSALHPPRLGRLIELSQRFIQDQQWSNNGPLVRDLEQRLALWHEAEHCVAMSSGFWSLVLTARALHERTDPLKTSVVMPSLTYRRLADAMNWAGLVPHFVDIDPHTLALDAASAAAAMGPSVGLVCAVNPMAGTIDPEPFEQLCREHGVPLLLDSVEGQVDTYPDGSRVGTQGDAEVFSCHSSKFLNGCEGGYVTTNNADLAESLRLARSFGYQGPENVVDIGFNAKMSELQAAWVLTALEGVGPQKQYYEALFHLYEWYLRDVPEVCMRNTNEDSSYKNIVIEVGEDVGGTAKDVVAHLNLHGAQAREYYAPPLHLKSLSFPVIREQLPTTESIGRRLLLLPSGSRLSADHVARIARLLRNFFDGSGGTT